MKHKIFSVFDSKTEAFLPPFSLKTVGEAERVITSMVSDPNNNFCKYAEDFTLYELGTWNDENCKYELLDTPFSVGLLVQYKKDKE